MSNAVFDSVIHKSVSLHAARTPDSVALIHGERRITYGQLEAAACSLAAELAARGVTPGVVVPLVVPRSARLVAMQLAVLKCGAAYATLDPRWPLKRQVGILDHIAPVLTITDSYLPHRFSAYKPPPVEVWPANENARFGDPADVDADAAATIFFTSGTTGKPKGVISPHRAVTRLFGPGGLPGFGPGHTTSLAAALPWDMYAFELWGQLTTGGTVMLISGDYLLPSMLREGIAEAGVDTIFLTPSLFNLFVDEDQDCFTGLKNVYLAGEKVSPRHVRAFISRYPEIPLFNGYGPAESCIVTTMRQVSLADCAVPGGVPIGTAVPRTTVHVLKPDNQVCAIGEPGEICIAGDGLALGYLKDQDLTREKFPVVTLDGAPVRIYRSGDMGLLDEKGVLHFRGRDDGQVKISGHRVELAEIEITTRGLPGIRDCAAVALESDGGHAKGLALFYLTEPESDAGSLKVRDQLLDRLPAYLVPGIVRRLDQFSVTDIGKLDRRALRELASSRPLPATIGA